MASSSVMDIFSQWGRPVLFDQLPGSGVQTILQVWSLRPVHRVEAAAIEHSGIPEIAEMLEGMLARDILPHRTRVRDHQNTFFDVFGPGGNRLHGSARVGDDLISQDNRLRGAQLTGSDNAGVMHHLNLAEIRPLALGKHLDPHLGIDLRDVAGHLQPEGRHAVPVSQVGHSRIRRQRLRGAV